MSTAEDQGATEKAAEVEKAIVVIEAICVDSRSGQMTQENMNQIESAIDRVYDVLDDIMDENKELKRRIAEMEEAAAKYSELHSNVKQFAEWHKSDYTTLGTSVKGMLNKVMWEKLVACLDREPVPAPVFGLFAQRH